MCAARPKTKLKCPKISITHSNTTSETKIMKSRPLTTYENYADDVEGYMTSLNALLEVWKTLESTSAPHKEKKEGYEWAQGEYATKSLEDQGAPAMYTPTEGTFDVKQGQKSIQECVEWIVHAIRNT